MTEIGRFGVGAMVVSASLSCYRGHVGDGGSPDAADEAALGTDPDEPGATDPNSGPDDGGDPQGGGCVVAADVVGLRRLTARELAHSLEALFGDVVGGSTGLVSRLPAEPLVEGFENSVEAANVSQALMDSLHAIAEDVADTVAANSGAGLPCNRDTLSTGCVDAWLGSFGTKVFRRPLTSDEKRSFLALYDEVSASRGAAEGFSAVVSAMLLSPQFVFRVEDSGTGGDRVLAGYELASRLSFWLWAQTPDDELLRAAAAGELEDDAGLQGQVERLLDDPRAQLGFERFVSNWLGLGGLGSASKDPALFPAYDAALGQAMIEQSVRFFGGVLAGGGGWEALMLESRVPMTTPLAGIYGSPDPSAPWAEVALAETERAGILTQAAFLAAHAHSSVSSPVQRGVFVRERILCQDLPPPPDDVVITISPPDPESTTRQRAELHTSNAACHACHRLIDPLGFPFESYDAIGRFRTTEGGGLAVDTTGELRGTAESDGSVGNALELVTRLARSDEGRSCFARQWFRYALGRIESDEDLCIVDALARTQEQGGSLRSLVVKLVQSPVFRKRRAL